MVFVIVGVIALVWLVVALGVGLVVGRMAKARDRLSGPSASQRRHEGLRRVV
jgi:hypothetical protein